MKPNLALLGALWTVAWASAGGCARDHGRLATGDGAAATSARSASGSGGSGQGGASSRQAEQSASSTTSASSSAGPMEPPGATKLTFVNGIVDADAASFCFSKYPPGPGAESPWPNAAGLPFAHGGVVDLATVIPMGDVEVSAVIGDPNAIAGKSCAALAATPGVQLAALAVLPSAALSEPKSLLLVSDGCIGGPSHQGGLQTLVCGDGYTPSAPTAGLLAGFMSRLGKSTAVRMQFADAVAAMPQQAAQVKVAVAPAGGQPLPAVDSWGLGAVAPFPPFDQLSLALLGQIGDAQIQLTVLGQPHPTNFGDAFKNGTFLIDDVKDGDGIVFVAVGAQPGIGAGSWWHAMAFTVVKADP